MPLNTNIALGVQTPQFESPMKLALVANQLREAQMKAQEYEAVAEERNRLRALNPADPDYENQLMRVSPTQGIAYRKGQREADKFKSESESAAATRDKIRAEAAGIRQKMGAQALRDISQRPSDANIIAHLEDVLESNLYSDQEKAAVQKRSDMLRAMPFEDRKSFLASQGASASELKPTTSVGPTGIVQTPAFGGGQATVVPGTGAAFQMTPAQIAQNKIAQGQLDATIRSQNLTERRERDRMGNDQNPNVVARQVVGDDGTVTNYNKFGEIIGTQKGVGKTSATYAKTEAQKKTMAKDLDLAISELAKVTEKGGLIDQSTGSYLGKAVDVGARVFGQATKGDIAAGQLAPIADLALKMVPRFEGPQSNADTTSYKQAAGQLADSTLPAEIRKAAGKEVLRLMKARKNQFITSDMASGNTATPTPDVRSQADAILNGGN